MSDNAKSTRIHASRPANRLENKVAIITSEMINVDGGCAVKISPPAMTAQHDKCFAADAVVIFPNSHIFQ